MGTRFRENIIAKLILETQGVYICDSSNNDYNRVLATQPRTSINITKFETPKNFQEQPYTHSFSIPAPVLISKNSNRSEDRTSTLTDRSAVVNQPAASIQPLIQGNPSPAVEPTHISSVINYSTQQNFKQEQPKQQIVPQNNSYSTPSNVSTHNQTMKDDAVIMSRSVLNPNNHRRSKNHRFSSSRPFRTIVERNGKQFLVEFKERTERRYVQCIDETTHQIRYFEVIDRIPYRIIRPYKNKSQSLSQKDTSQNTFVPKFRLNQYPALPPVLNDGSKTVASSNSIHNRNNRVNLAVGHDLQHNNINTSPNHKTSQNLHYTSTTSDFLPQFAPISRSTSQNAADPIYHHSRHIQFNSGYSLPIGPKSVSNQYSSKRFPHQPLSFRAHTPTISNGSTSTSYDSDEESETDENEIIVRILKSNESPNIYEKTNLSLVKNGGYDSPTPVDPFARSLNSGDHPLYRKRPTIQNYAEPMMNNRKFHLSTYPDYAPIPIVIKQPNHNEYSHRNDVLTSGYDG